MNRQPFYHHFSALFTGTRDEIEGAESALAAAARRAPQVTSERATVSQRHAARASYQARLTATAAKVATEIRRRRATGESTRALERYAAELAGYLDVERCAERRREELAVK